MKLLEKHVKRNSIPHFVLFSGPSGCGKTTLARILVKKLKCGKSDFAEINCANFRGIDSVREIAEKCKLMPMTGDCRIYLMDECHQLTNAAQSALLKLLEDTPGHVYFFWATTDPQKLLPTVKNRATEIVLKSLKRTESEALVKDICEQESIELKEAVVDEIVEKADGSARRCLVLLDAASQEKTTDRQLAVIQSSVGNTAAIELARTLMKPKVSWGDVGKILKSLDDEDPEGLRRMVLGYFRSILLNGGKFAPRSAAIIECFEDNLFDSGKAGLALACWRAVHDT